MSQTKDERRATYLASKRADLTAYAAMIGEEFASRVNRLAKIIGTSHEPSVGGYKESILRSGISKFIPKRYSVGTGFVVFTKESQLKGLSTLGRSSTSRGRAAHQMNESRHAAPAVLLSTIT